MVNVRTYEYFASHKAPQFSASFDRVPFFEHEFKIIFLVVIGGVLATGKYKRWVKIMRDEIGRFEDEVDVGRRCTLEGR